MEERKLINIKKEHEKILQSLYHLEDLTNYDIQELGLIINLMQDINLLEEYEKTQNKQSETQNIFGLIYRHLNKSYSEEEIYLEMTKFIEEQLNQKNQYKNKAKGQLQKQLNELIQLKEEIK